MEEGSRDIVHERARERGEERESSIRLKIREEFGCLQVGADLPVDLAVQRVALAYTDIHQ